jgi:hypothetical protein
VELILALLGAGPIGYFTKSRKHALVVYLLLWAIVLPIQTVVVFAMDGAGGDALYWVVNALILCLGIGLNLLGSRLGERRRSNGAVVEAV